MLSEELNVYAVAVARHLELIGMSKRARYVSVHSLNENPKSRRFEVAFTLLLRTKDDPFLEQIVICTDWKWILYDNRRHSTQWLDHDRKPPYLQSRNCANSSV